MPDFGVTETGFVPKRLLDVKAELEEAIRTAFGNVNIAPQSGFGQLIGIFSKQAADLWEAAEGVYLAMYPASAEHVSLDNVASMVGITRLAAVSTLVIGQAKGVEGTVLPIERQVKIPETGTIFSSTTEKTITKTAADRLKVIAANAVNGSSYIVTINGTDFVYVAGAGTSVTIIGTALVALINAGAEPVTAVLGLAGAFEILSDDVEGAFDGDVNANMTIQEVSVAVPFLALLTGALPAPAGSVTTIVTPVAGWASVTNREDGIEGRGVETDTELRVRRRVSIKVIGASNAEAITARLLQEIAGVTSVRIYQNRTNAVDAFGLPAHSFESIIEGGEDTVIAEKLWSELGPAGIETHGTTTVVVEDLNGDAQNVKFTRPSFKYIWVKVTITEHAEEEFPLTGEQSIKDSIMEYVADLQVGNDVIHQRFYGPVYETPGIATAVIEFATAATEAGPPGAYTAATVAIGRAERASFAEDRITIIGP